MPFVPRADSEKIPRILLIEDNPFQASLIQHVLRRAKPEAFDSETADTLDAGLQRLKACDFDVVIVDLGLPGNEGLEAFDAVRAAFPSVAAVVIAGNADEDLAMEAVRRGAQDYIVRECVSERTIIRALRYAIERKRLEEQLLRSQKQQAMGSLADAIAHEFNNLLQVIQGYTRYALEGLSPDEQRHSDLSQVMNAAERAAALTNRLLNFGRPHRLHKTEIQLDGLVSELADMLRPLLGEAIHFDVDLGTETKTVMADANLLQQVFMNLCINSRDAMPEGGTLRISSRTVNIDETSPEMPAAKQPGAYLVLSISDDGCGIPEEVKDRIYEPFFTTKDPDNGTGLGLSVVYRIVQQHDGVIQLHSEIGHGTRFDIFLPAAPDDSDPARPLDEFDLLVPTTV